MKTNELRKTIDMAWRALDRACDLATYIHPTENLQGLLARTEEASVAVERAHRRCMRPGSYRVGIDRAARAMVFTRVVKALNSPPVAPKSYADAAVLRRDVVLAYALAEGLTESQHRVPNRGFGGRDPEQDRAELRRLIELLKAVDDIDYARDIAA